VSEESVLPDRDQIRDELLVVRCQLGERAAFEELVRAHAPALARHMGRIAGRQVSDDLLQDVWLRAFRGIIRLREGASLRPWLLGIAHHVVMDHFRLRYADNSAPLEDDFADAPADDREEMLALLEARLAALPVIERETLTLFYLEEMSLADIARIQSVPTGTVKSRLFRARNLLRGAMLTQGEKP
jgi:RNA polymerase sigma-70 factor (ECF subfamily)